MLDGNASVESFEWAAHVGAVGWEELDRRLRRITRQRAALDVEEAWCLVRARRVGIHRKLGMATFLEYLERVLGYEPRVALDRMRVADALEMFPGVRDAFARGELVHSAVRELARVVVPETEAEWIDAARGKSMREIEALVSGRRKGDRPADAPDPDLVRCVLRFEVSAATFALVRDAERALADEARHALDHDTMLSTLCRRASGARRPPPGRRRPRRRARSARRTWRDRSAPRWSSSATSRARPGSRSSSGVPTWTASHRSRNSSARRSSTHASRGHRW